MSTYGFNNPVLWFLREPRVGSRQTDSNTMKATKFLITASATLFAAAQASAQMRGAPPAPPQLRPPPPLPLIFAVMDVNQDGKISADEWAGSKDAFKKLDKNGDGFITPMEALAPAPHQSKGRKNSKDDNKPTGDNTMDPPAPPANGDSSTGGPPPRPVPPLLAALDTDHDGSLSASEIDNAPESLRKLDKNGDGTITPDEMRPEPPPAPKDQDGSGTDNQQPPPGDNPEPPAPPAAE